MTNALYKKETIGNTLFPAGVFLAEDAVFNYLVLKAYGRYAYVNLNLYYYFQRPDSAVHRQSITNRLAAPKYLIDHYWANELQDKRPYVAEQIAKWLLDISLSDIGSNEDPAKIKPLVNDAWKSF